MICAGIDAGSRTIKVVLVDADKKNLIAKAITDQGIEQNTLASKLFESLLTNNNLNKKSVSRIVATGYGRNGVKIADTTITEITCHAVGVRCLLPETKTIIDIGGQDSKLIQLDKAGKVRDFAMNDRCAAGTGQFLEIVAERLEVKLDSLGRMAEKSKSPSPVSSMCVVFAETEIIGLLAAGQPREDIVAGIQKAVANRLVSMTGINVASPVIFTGGVAMISGMNKALQNTFKCDVTVSPQPQMTGALGAAILASEQINAKN